MVVSVSVGMCAYNEEARIGPALRSLDEQRVPDGFEVTEIFVVASGCTDGTEAIVEAWAASHPTARLLREPTRNGKVSALNLILDQYRGDILVFVNADAVLFPDALAGLLRPFADDPALELACGRPVPENGQHGLSPLLQGFLWEIHNRTLATLSSRDEPNHCCDELMALRRGFVTALPPTLINDGAYLGALAASRGHTVRFCEDAPVLVRIPRSLHGFVQQRRRILTGHQQVRDLLHRSPRTLEELVKARPDLAASVVVSAGANRRAGLAAFLVVGVPLELVALSLALADRTRGVDYRPAWPVVGGS